MAHQSLAYNWCAWHFGTSQQCFTQQNHSTLFGKSKLVEFSRGSGSMTMLEAFVARDLCKGRGCAERP